MAKGLPASPGAAVGQVVFTAEEAEAWHSQGKTVILVKSNSLSLLISEYTNPYTAKSKRIVCDENLGSNGDKP